MALQPLPGRVWIQLLSLPAGATGPNQTSVEPSAFATTPRSLLRLGYGWSVCSIDRVWLS